MYEQIGYIVLSKDEKKILNFGKRFFMDVDNLNGANIRVFRTVNLVHQYFNNSNFPNSILDEIIIKKVKLNFEEVEE